MVRFSANLGFLWKELPLTQAVLRAKRAGFDAVEFHYPYDTPAGEVRAALTAAALPAVGLNTRLGDVSAGDIGLAALPGREAEARAAIDEGIDYVRAIGAGYIHVTAGRPGPTALKQAHNTFLGALDYAAGRVDGSDIRILIEPLNPTDAPGYFLNHLDQAAAIISELGRPNIRILFDCYHAQLTGGDLTRRLERLLPLIHHIQIAGAPSRREPDEGEVAYDRLLRAIARMGYRGFIAAEYQPRASVEDGIGWLSSMRAALAA
jgi:hydroxypyruvate isomerase